jgi:hypothetical protein
MEMIGVRKKRKTAAKKMKDKTIVLLLHIQAVINFL